MGAVLDYLAKWLVRFQPNTVFKIEEKDFQDFATDSATLFNRGPNAMRSLHKRFRYLTQAEVLANGGEGDAFENLDYDTCCVGTQLIVEYYQPNPLVAATRNQVLVTAYDPVGANFVYSDGSFRPGDRIAAAKFVPATSAAAQYGYVRRDTVPAGINNWRVDELSIWELSGVDEFATAKQAGGPWPAFTGVDDAYWKPAAPPAASSGGQTRLVRLSGRGASAASLLSAGALEPWVLYAIEGQPDPADPAGLAGTWNRSGNVETVYLPAVSATAFAASGWLLLASGLTQDVSVDGQAGSWVIKQSGGGGASTFSQLGGLPADNAALNTVLTAKADLDANGYVLASQLPPDRVRLAFSFPAGQNTSKIITLAFPDQPGQYQVEQVANLSTYTFYLNGVQVAITNQILYLGDEVTCIATVPAGATGGYIYLRKL